MTIVNYESKLCDLLSFDPAIITVLNRFDIQLGVSDKTVTKVCEEKGIDKAFFTTMLNTFINKDYFPQEILSTFSAAKIIDYLTKTNNYYQYYQIPNIERHFAYLLSKSDANNSSLAIIQKFFFEVKQELQLRIHDDCATWFPQIISLEQAIGHVTIAHIDANICQEDSIEAKVSDLMNMFIMHLSGTYDVNLAHALPFMRSRKTSAKTTALESAFFAHCTKRFFQHKARQTMGYNIAIITHNTLEAIGIKHILEESFASSAHIYACAGEIPEHLNAVYDYFFCDTECFASALDFFLPRKQKLIMVGSARNENNPATFISKYDDESTIIDKINTLFSDAKLKTRETQTELSQRETDVLRLIASGMMNKEIADNLGISINTVLTHRKNLTAKLGIRSVSGLSFYAMMNGIIAPK